MAVVASPAIASDSDEVYRDYRDNGGRITPCKFSERQLRAAAEDQRPDRQYDAEFQSQVRDERDRRARGECDRRRSTGGGGGPTTGGSGGGGSSGGGSGRGGRGERSDSTGGSGKRGEGGERGRGGGGRDQGAGAVPSPGSVPPPPVGSPEPAVGDVPPPVPTSGSADGDTPWLLVLLAALVALTVLVGGAILLANLDQFTPNWDPFIPENTGKDGEFGWSGIIRGASIVFFAYIGFEAVSTAGQEAKNPAKDMPFGIIGSLVACTIIYILVSIVLTLIVPYTDLNVPDPVAVAVDAFGPQWAWFASTIKVGAIIGLTSVILVLMYGQTRIFYTMARDGLLPKPFARVHPRFRTPWINTLVVGLGVATAAGFFDINFLGDATSVGTLAAFSIVCLTVIWLRQTHPAIPRGFRVPFYPVFPALGVLSSFALIFTVEDRVLRFFGWYVLGAIALYFIYGMRNSELAKGRDIMADDELPMFPEDAPRDESGEPVVRP